MAEALLVKSGGGTDSSDLTATLSQVLSGYTAMTNDSNDDPGTGTMPNRGAVTQSLNAGGSYTIPQGYHNGSGKVTANSLSSQTSGNASSAQILTGYNAWVNGSNINGSMPNRGNLNFNPSSNTSQSVVSGYYSGGTISSGNAYNTAKAYLIASNVTGSGSVSATSVPGYNSMNQNNFVFVVRNINLYITSWGHSSDTHGDPASNAYNPVSKSYNAGNGTLTYNILQTSISSGTYGQTAGGTCRVTTYCDIYAIKT